MLLLFSVYCCFDSKTIEKCIYKKKTLERPNSNNRNHSSQSTNTHAHGYQSLVCHTSTVLWASVDRADEASQAFQLELFNHQFLKVSAPFLNVFSYPAEATATEGQCFPGECMFLVSESEVYPENLLANGGRIEAALYETI